MDDVVKRLRHGGFTIRDIDAACGRIEALEHELAEARLDASARKQAAKMLAFLQREGFFVGVEMRKEAA